MVSSNSALISDGAGKAYALMCYISAANSVTIVFSIGATDISKGNGANKIKDGFSVDIAVIDATA